MNVDINLEWVKMPDDDDHLEVTIHDQLCVLHPGEVFVLAWMLGRAIEQRKDLIKDVMAKLGDMIEKARAADEPEDTIAQWHAKMDAAIEEFDRG